MNPIDLDSLLSLAEKQARMVMMGLRKPLVPSWVLVNAEGKFQILGTPWTNDQEKFLAQVYIRAQIKKYDTVAYSFVTEAWTAVQPPGWKPEQGVDVRPAERPDRQECVIALASDGQVTKWRRWDIIRDHHEVVVKFEPQSMESEVPPQSWMAEMMNEALTQERPAGKEPDRASAE